MSDEKQAHMVQQIIKYSDGTETVIDYRGVIEFGKTQPTEEIVDVEAPSVEAEEVAG